MEATETVRILQLEVGWRSKFNLHRSYRYKVLSADGRQTSVTLSRLYGPGALVRVSYRKNLTYGTTRVLWHWPCAPECTDDTIKQWEAGQSRVAVP
jgi:hypothetical protein